MTVVSEGVGFTFISEGVVGAVVSKDVVIAAIPEGVVVAGISKDVVIAVVSEWITKAVVIKDVIIAVFPKGVVDTVISKSVAAAIGTKETIIIKCLFIIGIYIRLNNIRINIIRYVQGCICKRSSWTRTFRTKSITRDTNIGGCTGGWYSTP